VTDLATLALAVDSSQVKTGVTELDKLTASGAKAQGAVDGLGKAASQAGRQIGTATEQAAAMASAAQSAAASAMMMSRGVVVSAGQQRAGMQQLSFQIGDVAQQFALGTNPMIIFAQQGGQVVQAISMMKGGASGLIGFLAGPWGAVMMGAVMILGTLSSKLFAAGDAAKDMENNQADLAKYVDFTTGKIRQQISAVVALAEAQRMGAKAQEAADAYKKNRQALIDAGTLNGGDTSGFALGTDLSAVTTQATKARLELVKLTEQYQAGAINVNQFGKALKQLGEAEPSIRRQVNTMIQLGGTVSQSADANREYVAGLKVLTGTATDSDRAFLHLQSTTQTHTKSVNSQIEALARYEAASDRVSKAQARVQLLERQAPEFADAKSAGAIKFQHELAAAYREVDAAQKAASLDKKADAAARAAARHAEELARQSGAMDASARSGLELAKAYLAVEAGTDDVTVAVGAAVIAEARHRAASEAVRKGISEEAQARRVLANMAADGAVQAGKAVYQMRIETGIRDDLNEQLAAGKISLGEYNEALKEGAALKPLIDLQAAAKAKGLTEAYNVLTSAIEAMKQAMGEGRTSQATSAFEQARIQGEEEIERLKLEYKLIGATNEQHAVELAMLQKKQALRNSTLSAEDQQKLVEQAGEIARATERNNVAQDVHNKLLTEQLDILDTLDQRARTLADSLADAFGAPGEAIGKLLTDFTGYAVERERLQDKLNAQILAAGENQDAVAQARAEYARNAGTAEMQHYANILGAAKSFFKEGTTGYKVMTTLEKVYSAIQLANMIKSLVFDKVQTASAVGNAMVRGSANAAAGAASIFSQLGAFGFPVVAAMVGVLAAMGLKGLGGGGKGPSIPSAEDLQAKQGAGSVLGDSSAKSDSIAASLDLMLKNTNKDLEYSSEMVRSLRVIEGGIGSLAALVARQIGVSGGAFDAGSLGLGTKSGTNPAMFGVAGILGGPVGLAAGFALDLVKKIPVIGDVVGGIVKALFGTKKTVTLLDQGFEFAAQSVGQIVSSGVVGDIYNALQTTKKSKFFGISTGTKTSYSTQTSALDGGFTDQINLLIGSLRDGIVSAAGTIGIDGAAAMVDAFQLNLGKISLKDLKGDDLENAIEAVFSKAADDMAGARHRRAFRLPEGGRRPVRDAARLARDYQVVDIACSRSARPSAWSASRRSARARI
jgi:hypothetical protein